MLCPTKPVSEHRNKAQGMSRGWRSKTTWGKDPMDHEKLGTVEEKLDRAVLRQRLLIEEMHCQRIKCTKRLRVFLEPGEGSLRISGRVINDYKNFAEMKMSDVLRRFYVEISYEDRREILEWTKGRGSVDAFEVGDIEKATGVRIAFDFCNLRDTFRLSTGLQRLLNKRTENRSNLLIDLWKYARLNNLMRGGVVHCNEDLRAIFGTETLRLDELDLSRHLLPLDTLVLDVDLGRRETFDVEMDVDDLVDFPVLYSSKKVHALKRKAEELREMVKSCRERVDVLGQFIPDPAGYIDRNIVCEGRNFFYDILVQDLVFKLLSASK